METNLKHPSQYDFCKQRSRLQNLAKTASHPLGSQAKRLKIDSVPPLQVNTEGFSAVEDGDLTQRFLLSDVSSEAAHGFLNYLYMADTDMPPSLAPDLRSLALRWDCTFHTLHGH